MELEKLLKISIEYLSEYFGVLFSTIKSPRIQFPPKLSTDDRVVILSSDSVTNTRLNTKLLSFVLISIFIGSVLNTNIPGRNQGPDFVSMTIMILGYWFLFSFLVHVFCRSFGGGRAFTETLSVNLQVFATIHVLSSFVTFLWGVVIKGFGSEKIEIYLQGYLPKTVIESPIYAYFVVQFILVLIYLPLANRRLHGLGLRKLNRAISSRALVLVLARTETALFYLVFLIISVTIVGLSKNNYHVHNFPLSQPDVSREINALTADNQESSIDDDDLLVVADVFSDGSARLSDVIHPPRDNKMLREFESALRQDATAPYFDRSQQTMKVIIR